MKRNWSKVLPFHIAFSSRLMANWARSHALHKTVIWMALCLLCFTLQTNNIAIFWLSLLVFFPCLFHIQTKENWQFNPFSIFLVNDCHVPYSIHKISPLSFVISSMLFHFLCVCVWVFYAKHLETTSMLPDSIQHSFQSCCSKIAKDEMRWKMRKCWTVEE